MGAVFHSCSVKRADSSSQLLSPAAESRVNKEAEIGWAERLKLARIQRHTGASNSRTSEQALKYRSLSGKCTEEFDQALSFLPFLHGDWKQVKENEGIFQQVTAEEKGASKRINRISGRCFNTKASSSCLYCAGSVHVHPLTAKDSHPGSGLALQQPRTACLYQGQPGGGVLALRGAS